MADEKSARSDDGKGAPGGAVNTTISGRPRDGRQLPGGSIAAANTPIGINAVDRDDLPSGGMSTGQERYEETPVAPDPRPAPKP